MKIVLAKNEKGLYSSDGARVYFPDRKSKVVAGFVEAEISNDKETYAFVSCKQITTSPIIEALIAGKVDINDIKSAYEQDGSQFWQDSKEDIFAYVDGEVIDVICSTTSNAPEILEWDEAKRRCRNVVRLGRDFIRSLNLIPLVKISTAYSKYLVENAAEFPSRNRAMELIVNNLYSKPKSIEILANRAILLDRGCLGSEFYVYDAEKDALTRVMSYNVDSAEFASEDVTDKVLEMIKNCRITLRSYCSEDAMIVTKVITCFGNAFTAKFIASGNFTYELYQANKAELDENEKELQAFKKSVGKYCTARNLTELTKLSLEQYQYGGAY